MSVAKPYAKALYQSAADLNLNAVQIDELQSQLMDLSVAISDIQVKRMIGSPAIKVADRKTVLEKLLAQMGASELLKRFCFLLLKKNRLSLLPAICNELSHARIESQGGIVGQIESAEGLSAKDLEELTQLFTKRSGKNVSFQVKQVPELLAGFRVVLQGVTYDGSLKNRMDQLRSKFLEIR
jgi:F-type H+-transporting ATPase subunit delta